jgi:D-cysteine desulfhydrase
MESAALELAREGKRPYVIPEGGSNGLGALGYVDAMAELRKQLDAGLGGGKTAFEEIVVACGLGGTAAGIALGAAKFGVAKKVRAVAVCNDASYFERAIANIVSEARALDATLEPPAPLVVDEAARGPAYGVLSVPQKQFLVGIARSTGTMLDPVYTGKALFGLADAVRRGDLARGARVLFVHTGGLPGLLAPGDVLEAVLP